MLPTNSTFAGLGNVKENEAAASILYCKFSQATKSAAIKAAAAAPKPSVVGALSARAALGVVPEEAAALAALPPAFVLEPDEEPDEPPAAGVAAAPLADESEEPELL